MCWCLTDASGEQVWTGEFFLPLSCTRLAPHDAYCYGRLALAEWERARLLGRGIVLRVVKLPWAPPARSWGLVPARSYLMPVGPGPVAGPGVATSLSYERGKSPMPGRW